jgi:fatty acid desaturase
MGSIFLTATMLAGIVYSFWPICTHDMPHQTLTGWKWFDPIMPRLISWPILSPYGVYPKLHRLHHAWNGIDWRDPERDQ